MGFYTFGQNNSGGNFVFDKQAGITHFVIIEAGSEGQAIERAEEIGLYFDGAGDCPCCGYRWSDYLDDATDEPTIYGKPAADYANMDNAPILWMKPNPEIVVHYLDKPFEWIDVQSQQINRRQNRKPQLPE
jgi:hypothetical protein